MEKSRFLSPWSSNQELLIRCNTLFFFPEKSDFPLFFRCFFPTAITFVTMSYTISIILIITWAMNHGFDPGLTHPESVCVTTALFWLRDD